MNIYKTRARLKLDQVRADIADLPDDANTAAMRGLADLIESVLAEPDRQIDAREHDPTTGLTVAPAKLSRAGVKEYPSIQVTDTFDKRVHATVEFLSENGYKSLPHVGKASRVDLDCGAKLAFYASGKALVQGKCNATERVEITSLLRADGWTVK